MILCANPSAQFKSYETEIEKAVLNVLRGNNYVLGKEVSLLEKEFSAYNFEFANTEILLKSFETTESECKTLLDKKLSLPAYDQCLKASHIFNLLDARGVIGVAERTGYITRIRDLAKGCGALWLNSQN